ncbi:hypothetical protein [Streptomyces gougerotii]
MAQVPEVRRRLTAAFGAPAGRMETFTEVSLPHGETPRRPDGVIRVERAGKLWTALVETKTNGNPLRAEQVQNYMDIAAPARLRGGDHPLQRRGPSKAGRWSR